MWMLPAFWPSITAAMVGAMSQTPAGEGGRADRLNASPSRSSRLAIASGCSPQWMKEPGNCGPS